METIFDYDPTPEELRSLAGPFGKERYLERVTPDDALAGLSMLFAMRRDGARADAYARRIEDDDLRFEFCHNDLISSSKAVNAASSRTDRASRAA